MAGWIRRLVAGEAVEVTGDMVDDLNAGHASAATAVSQAAAAEHLRSSGAAIRHADSHRTDIETALAARDPG